MATIAEILNEREERRPGNIRKELESIRLANRRPDSGIVQDKDANVRKISSATTCKKKLKRGFELEIEGEIREIYLTPCHSNKYPEYFVPLALKTFKEVKRLMPEVTKQQYTRMTGYNDVHGSKEKDEEVRLIDKLRNSKVNGKTLSGEWKKVYVDGYDRYGRKISVHYFTHLETNYCFDVDTKPGWSNFNDRHLEIGIIRESKPKRRVV